MSKSRSTVCRILTPLGPPGPGPGRHIEAVTAWRRGPRRAREATEEIVISQNVISAAASDPGRAGGPGCDEAPGAGPGPGPGNFKFSEGRAGAGGPQPEQAAGLGPEPGNHCQPE